MDGPNVEHSHRGRRTGHEHHAARAEGFEGRLIREFLPELDELALGVSEVPGRADLVGRDEIRPEDRTSQRVVRQLGHEQADTGHDISLELAAALDETL